MTDFRHGDGLLGKFSVVDSGLGGLRGRTTSLLSKSPSCTPLTRPGLTSHAQRPTPNSGRARSASSPPPPGVPAFVDPTWAGTRDSEGARRPSDAADGRNGRHGHMYSGAVGRRRPDGADKAGRRYYLTSAHISASSISAATLM